MWKGRGRTRQSEKLSSTSTKASAQLLESFSEELGRPFRVDFGGDEDVGLSYSAIRQIIRCKLVPKREGTVRPRAGSEGTDSCGLSSDSTPSIWENKVLILEDRSGQHDTAAVTSTVFMLMSLFGL